MPGFPGAQCSSVRLGLRANFHASACSRPPDPTRSTFTGASLSAFEDGRRRAGRIFTAAREAARSYEAGDASAGDLAHAINCYRELYELLTTEELDQQQRTPGPGRSP
jgi:hypothetical protein